MLRYQRRVAFTVSNCNDKNKANCLYDQGGASDTFSGNLAPASSSPATTGRARPAICQSTLGPGAKDSLSINDEITSSMHAVRWRDDEK